MCSSCFIFRIFFSAREEEEKKHTAKTQPSIVEEEVCLAEAVWKRVPGMCEPVFVVVWIAFRLTLTSLGNSLLDLD